MELIHKYNAALYDALKKENSDEVVKLCQDGEKYPDGPLHILTIHGDTVLHMAAYTVQSYLVTELLDLLANRSSYNLTVQNAVGNTILHEAAAFDELLPAAKKMLEMNSFLLLMTNKSEETALFRAAKFGQYQMFTFLDKESLETRAEINAEDFNQFYQKKDNSTILHAAVISGQFEVALKIAKRFEYLVCEKDENGMTALQHLARHSWAFQVRKAGYLKGFIYKCTGVSEDRSIVPESEDPRGWRVPLWEEMKEEMQTYVSAKELAKFLVMKDTESWTDTKPLEGIIVNTEPKKRNPEIPLLMATKAGCEDIVEEILKLYPQAVEHIDDKGRTILHIAIMYRQLEIFEKVEKMAILFKKLIQKTDYEGNSILHMVGKKTEFKNEQRKKTTKKVKNSDPNKGEDNKKDHTLKETNQNLVVQLQDDLLLFERVKRHCSELFYNNVNSKGQTAEQVFVLKTEDLHTEAKEWLKRTSENSSLVAVLIATVAFAAAYTVPGGSDDKTGVPILLNNPLFIIFTVTDVLSLTCTFTSLVIFLSILTSTFRLRDFKHSLPQKLMLGFTFLLLSVAMMMLSFAATVALMIRNKERWTKIALYTVAFLPVTIFVLSYMPLYLPSLKTFKYIIEIIKPYFPHYTGSIKSENETKFWKFIGKSKTKFRSFTIKSRSKFWRFFGKSKAEVPHPDSLV
ncbi:ankyrin repeat-containing protein At5g02620-like [Cornus florida]|uniref:ankyrin repeat-containing protein At5g02620-like n=1 Tax=Cornus florida TaxID=4283 RepID=UPI00289BD74A|nr:ankyrin repeat-containing protein At5g02620-like [Cornus florida]